MSYPTAFGQLTKFIANGELNQETAGPGTNSPAVHRIGYTETFFSYNSDSGQRVQTPADPKNLRALAEYNSTFTNYLYEGIEEVAENWQDPDKNYRVVGIFDKAPTEPSPFKITGVNLSGIPKNKIFRRLGSGWCFPIWESLPSTPGSNEYRAKFWNSQNRREPAIKYKVTYTVFWSYYPPNMEYTGLSPIEGEYDFDITFDGKTQANAEEKTLPYPPRPTGTVTWTEPSSTPGFPPVQRSGEWSGWAGYCEKNGSVELLPPLPEFWIKQHA